MVELNKRRAQLAAAVASALFLAACGSSGGGGSNGGGSGGPVGGGGGGGNDGGNNGGDAPITISGKAADGYLAGATVCVDVNANMRCDEDEPKATTVAGGAFTIEVPDDIDASAHAIVVEVNEATIDEDTGFAVGKPFVLSAPAGQSEFISPITTIVHGILQQNPALTLDEVVTQVKLSIGASSDISLFEDYVAAKQDAESDVAESYARLHKIAQVSAKVLAENHEAIMAAAANQGIDPAQANAALVALVTNQAIDLLEDAAEAVDEVGDDFDIEEFNVPAANVADLTKRIADVEAAAGAKKVSVESLVTQGLYWLWGEEDDDGSEFEYGVMRKAETAGRLQESWFIHNGSSWVEGTDEDEELNSLLGPNGWVEIADSADNFAASYQADGSAVLTLDGTDFSLKFTATEVDVSGKPIKSYLGFEDHEGYLDTISGNPVFSAGAKIYRVNFVTLKDTYELFNWYECGPDSPRDPKGNCNVVHGFATGSLGRPAKTFSEVIYPANHQDLNDVLGLGNEIYVRIYEGGVVQVTDTAAPEGKQESRGKWEYRTVHGQQIMMLTLPDRFTPRFWNSGQQILAIRDGYVRRGTFTPAGAPDEIGEIQFNETAFNDIKNYSSKW